MAHRVLRYLTSLGVGLLPGPRGTWGSALTWAAAMLYLEWTAAPLAGWWYGTVTAAVAALAIASSDAAVRRGVFGPSHDPGRIVIDEAAGMLVALYGTQSLGPAAVLAFILFRLFDIFKPFPVGRSQRLPGGWGVVIDDLLAGLYAWATVQLVFYCWPWSSAS